MTENAFTATERKTVSIMTRFFNLGPDSYLLGIIGKVAQMKTLANVLVLVTGLAVLPAPAAYAAGILKFELKTSTTMREALVNLKNERVTLTLESGQEIEGKVAMVGDSIVYITQLTGKVFYDAVVSIDKINAIVLRKEF